MNVIQSNEIIIICLPRSRGLLPPPGEPGILLPLRRKCHRQVTKGKYFGGTSHWISATAWQMHSLMAGYKRKALLWAG